MDLELRRRTARFTKQTQMKSVHHLQLYNNHCLVHWTNDFPNVTCLTLERSNPFEEQEYISPMILRRFIPCERITELKAYVSHCYFKGLIQLIISSPNIEKLCLSRTGFDSTDLALIKYDETFQQMSTTNKIKDVNIAIQQCSFEDMKLLVNLFPRLEHLALCMAKGCLMEIVQYLLAEKSNRSPYLHSIEITAFKFSSAEKIISLIQSQNVPIDCVSDYSPCIRLWW
jgi:hypothetical protein